MPYLYSPFRQHFLYRPHQTLKLIYESDINHQYQPPKSTTTMSVPHASILNLPHELLLPITEHLVVEPRYDRSPYGDLTALAIAHRHFTNVVRSTIHGLETPSVPLPKAHALFRTLQ
jgi:hypothetical protein